MAVCVLLSQELLFPLSPQVSRGPGCSRRGGGEHHRAGEVPLEASQLLHKASGISALPSRGLQLVPAAKLWWQTAPQLHRNNCAPVIPSAPSTGLVEVG